MCGSTRERHEATAGGAGTVWNALSVGAFPFLTLNQRVVHLHLLPTGNKYWVFKDTTLQPGYPHDLVSLGSGIPPHGIDSAIWWEDVGKTYFFKGNRSVCSRRGRPLSGREAGLSPTAGMWG